MDKNQVQNIENNILINWMDIHQQTLSFPFLCLP